MCLIGEVSHIFHDKKGFWPSRGTGRDHTVHIPSAYAPFILYTCLLDLTSAVYTQIMQTQHAICLSNGMIIKKNKQRRRKIIFPLAA